MTDIAGKSVFITGAGSGIGYQAALAFAQEGARIVATDISQAGLDALKAEIEGAGGACRTAILNVTDEEATIALVNQLAAEGALPDIAVNNAGIVYLASFLDTDMGIWRKTFDVNVLGVAIGSRTFADAWKRAGVKGHLVNLASMVSVMPQPSLSAYAASKAAVEALCDVLAIELKSEGIRVTSVHPGVINTPIIGNPDMMRLSEAQFESIKAHYIADGVDPSYVARDIVAGVRKNKTNVYSGPATGFAVFLKRLLPRTWFRGLIEKTGRRIGYLQ